MDAAAVIVALDALSALLMLVVAGAFGRVWLASRAPRHLLFALGATLVGVTFLTVGASEFDLGRDPMRWDHLRIAGQTGGVLVILFAYVRPGLAVGYAVAAVTVLFAALYLAFPPFLSFPDTRTALVVMHATTAAAWGACALLSLLRGGGSLSLRRLLVPGAFLAFAVSRYSWVLVDIVADDRLIPFVYPWRFVGIALLLAALAPPSRGEDPGET